MNLFLRILSVLYFIGFVLHLLDLFGLRLDFVSMSIEWKAWIIFLMIGDLVASIGLWRQQKWAVFLFIGIAIFQLIAYSGLLDSPMNQVFVICFHILTVSVYFFLKQVKRTAI